MHELSAWSESDSDRFIEYGAYFVPDRETQIRTVSAALPPLRGAAHLLDLGAGAGLLSAALAERFPEAVVHALDGSPAMLEQARRTLGDRAAQLRTELFDLADAGWRRRSHPVHAVVSSLCVHHLDGTEKAALFRDIAAMLEPGGAVVIADVVRPANEEARRIAEREWNESVRRHAMMADGHLGAYEVFVREEWNMYAHLDADPADKPSTLADQLRWLADGGLREVDVYWMRAGHAVFGARK